MTKTFLSDDIYHFIKICKYSSNNSVKNYISTDLMINWNKIKIFSDTTGNFVIHEQTEEWYLEKVKLLCEIMTDATKQLKIASEEIIDKLWKRSLWTNRVVDIIKCFDYFTENTQNSLLKCVLILTSLLERSLGNVYRIHNKNVPFLLKELLESEYLNYLLENETIILMQLFFGTTKTLNIRNIAWHGFLSKDEIEQNHVAILFILTASVGDILKTKGFQQHNIPYRPQITNLNEKIEEIESRNTFVNLFSHSEDLKEILNSNTFIGVTHSEFWKEIIQHRFENCNNNCLILLLPLFEHLLRRIFCKINLCDDRNITASRKEKYLTLDEIFDECFEGKRNKLLNLLNKGSIDFYNDLFSQLSGPRIRDKFSHGEIVLQNIYCRLTELLLNLILYTLLKGERFFNFNEYKFTNKDLTKELETKFEIYESVYHPNLTLKYKVLQASEMINKLVEIPKPQENEIETCDVAEDEYCFEEIKNECVSIFKFELKEFVQNMNIPTLFRPEEESKLIKKLIRISANITKISEQIISDNADRYTLFINNTLGLRQINRYDEILKSILIVFRALNCIVHIVVFIMHKQFLKTEKDFQLNIQIFKFLKETLNYEDKIYRFSNVKTNKWKKVRTLTCAYDRQVKYIFKKQLNNM